MPTSKISNDKSVMLRIANHLVSHAGTIYHGDVEGEPITAEQDDANEFALNMVEFANELRARFGRPALVLSTVRAARGDDWK